MGAAVAAVIVRREREIVDAYREAGATSADRGRTLAELGLDDGVGARRLRARAVLRDAGGGAWYLDEPSWAALRLMRRRVLLALLVFVALLALAGVFTSATAAR